MSQSFSLGAVIGAGAEVSRRELAEVGRVRRHRVIPEQACLWLAREQDQAGGWRRLDDGERRLDLRPLDDHGFANALRDVLHAVGFDTLEGVPSVVRWREGDFGLPSIGDGGTGFLLDLDARRSTQGGLLLFVDADGRAQGWRAEAGALTLFDPARSPLLTALPPGAPARMAVVGRAG